MHFFAFPTIATNPLGRVLEILAATAGSLGPALMALGTRPKGALN
jgi:hypothetical protein